MPYSYLTLGAARAEVAARLEDPGYVYWTASELNDLIDGAVKTWQALTGTYKQRATFTISSVAGVGGGAFYDLNSLRGGFLSPSATDRLVVSVVLAALLEPPLTAPWTGTGQFPLPQITQALQNRLNRW